MKCKFAKGEQDITTCPMIYIHWPGYYPTRKLYEQALLLLCPNMQETKTISAYACKDHHCHHSNSDTAQEGLLTAALKAKGVLEG